MTNLDDTSTRYYRGVKIIKESKASRYWVFKNPRGPTVGRFPSLKLCRKFIDYQMNNNSKRKVFLSDGPID